jgi:hypothetical protein
MILEYLFRFLSALVDVVNDMSFYLLFGFLLAGVLHILIPRSFAQKHLGGSSLWSSFKASAIGVPLPLCSCGVIPTGISFFKSGASKASTVSFLISTPQTGVDSMLITGAMIGWPFAVFRAFIAFITGVLGGLLTAFSGDKSISTPVSHEQIVNKKYGFMGSLRRVFSYSFGDFMFDMAHYLLLGTIIAAVISALIPDNYFETLQGNVFVTYLLVMLASIPLYICATSSVPIAAVLILKGLSPGAALIFLMAGPATNVATITVLLNTLGRKTTLAYLATIVGSSFLFGFILDFLVPAGWLPMISQHAHHDHSLLPEWLVYSSSSILTLLIVFHVSKRYLYSFKSKVKPQKQRVTQSTTFSVTGMTCNNCKMKVERELMKIGGIEQVLANPQEHSVMVNGFDLKNEKIRAKIEELGYKCKS